MLLRQLLESPISSSKLLVYDPFRKLDQEELVKEVIGLANADVDCPRNILFGINAGTIEGSGIVGIAESAMADLKKAHRLLSALIEPVLHLAFIYDRINGKLVGTLEIDGCDEGPFVVGQDFSENLSRGQCWIREGRQIRVVDPTDLAQFSRYEAAKQPTMATEKPVITVGFNDDLDCELLEMPVPDTSDPPFAQDKRKIKQRLNLKKEIKDNVSTVTPQISHLVLAPNHDPVAESDEYDTDTQTDLFRETGVLVDNAENYYYLEEKALKLNLIVCNKGNEGIEGVSIELGIPQVADFDVADQLYLSPFDKRSSYDVKKQGYPKVVHRDGAIMVSSSLGDLAPDRPVAAFKCELRLAVGPRMTGRKVAILYELRGQNEQSLGNGRLKIKFVKESA
jgi:hypothetical protein